MASHFHVATLTIRQDVTRRRVLLKDRNQAVKIHNEDEPRTPTLSLVLVSVSWSSLSDA
jgi:hypothetical protein